MRLCDDMWNVIPDIVSTATLIIGSYIPSWVPSLIQPYIYNYSLKENWEFQNQYLGNSYKDRHVIHPNVSIDELKKKMKAGDLLFTHNATFLDTFIVLTGGPVSHSAIL